jgi:hypothetical protein
MLLVALLVLYPALYSTHLAMLNKSMERFGQKWLVTAGSASRSYLGEA